eukprot:INCI693.1.p1 GENE.INCI693.1~~INCI693.1.p1  ORF type:complete len:2872 (-),score=448.94 INCI693.1:215-8830(-)
MSAARRKARALRNLVDNLPPCLLLEKCGPLKFWVRRRTDDPAVKFQVTIGSPQQCTCRRGGEHAGNGGADAGRALPGPETVCVHILFVMLKVMKVPVDSELLFKSSLSSREVSRVLKMSERAASSRRGRGQEQASTRPPLPNSGTDANTGDATNQRADRRWDRFQQSSSSTPRSQLSNGNNNGSNAAASAPTTMPGTVPPKPLEEDDTCPICFDDLAPMAPHELTWCALSCGRQLCLDCMGQSINHQKAKLRPGQAPKCPLCRGDWLEKLVPIKEAETKTRNRSAVSQGAATSSKPSSVPDGSAATGASVNKSARCAECRRVICERQYRCLHCRWYNLCATCFRDGANKHSRASSTKHHRFIWRPNDRLVEWNAPQQNRDRAALERRQLMMQLQSRELGPGDYALLQSLDQPTIVTMWDFLTAALDNPRALVFGWAKFLSAAERHLTHFVERKASRHRALHQFLVDQGIDWSRNPHGGNAQLEGNDTSSTTSGDFVAAVLAHRESLPLHLQSALYTPLANVDTVEPFVARCLRAIIAQQGIFRDLQMRAGLVDEGVLGSQRVQADSLSVGWNSMPSDQAEVSGSGTSGSRQDTDLRALAYQKARFMRLPTLVWEPGLHPLYPCSSRKSIRTALTVFTSELPPHRRHSGSTNSGDGGAQICQSLFAALLAGARQRRLMLAKYGRCRRVQNKGAKSTKQSSSKKSAAIIPSPNELARDEQQALPSLVNLTAGLANGERWSAREGVADKMSATGVLLHIVELSFDVYTCCICDQSLARGLPRSRRTCQGDRATKQQRSVTSKQSRSLVGHRVGSDVSARIGENVSSGSAQSHLASNGEHSDDETPVDFDAAPDQKDRFRQLECCGYTVHSACFLGLMMRVRDFSDGAFPRCQNCGRHFFPGMGAEPRRKKQSKNRRVQESTPSSLSTHNGLAIATSTSATSATSRGGQPPGHRLGTRPSWREVSRQADDSSSLSGVGGLIVSSVRGGAAIGGSAHREAPASSTSSIAIVPSETALASTAGMAQRLSSSHFGGEFPTSRAGAAHVETQLGMQGRHTVGAAAGIETKVHERDQKDASQLRRQQKERRRKARAVAMKNRRTVLIEAADQEAEVEEQRERRGGIEAFPVLKEVFGLWSEQNKFQQQSSTSRQSARNDDSGSGAGIVQASMSKSAFEKFCKVTGKSWASPPLAVAASQAIDGGESNDGRGAAVVTASKAELHNIFVRQRNGSTRRLDFDGFREACIEICSRSGLLSRQSADPESMILEGLEWSVFQARLLQVSQRYFSQMHAIEAERRERIIAEKVAAEAALEERKREKRDREKRQRQRQIDELRRETAAVSDAKETLDTGRGEEAASGAAVARVQATPRSTLTQGDSSQTVVQEISSNTPSKRRHGARATKSAKNTDSSSIARKQQKTVHQKTAANQLAHTLTDDETVGLAVNGDGRVAAVVDSDGVAVRRRAAIPEGVQSTSATACTGSMHPSITAGQQRTASMPGVNIGTHKNLGFNLFVNAIASSPTRNGNCQSSPIGPDELPSVLVEDVSTTATVVGEGNGLSISVNGNPKASSSPTSNIDQLSTVASRRRRHVQKQIDSGGRRKAAAARKKKRAAEMKRQAIGDPANLLSAFSSVGLAAVCKSDTNGTPVNDPAMMIGASGPAATQQAPQYNKTHASGPSLASCATVSSCSTLSRESGTLTSDRTVVNDVSRTTGCDIEQDTVVYDRMPGSTLGQAHENSAATVVTTSDPIHVEPSVFRSSPVQNVAEADAQRPNSAFESTSDTVQRAGTPRQLHVDDGTKTHDKKVNADGNVDVAAQDLFSHDSSVDCSSEDDEADALTIPAWASAAAERKNANCKFDNASDETVLQPDRSSQGDRPFGGNEATMVSSSLHATKLTDIDVRHQQTHDGVAGRPPSHRKSDMQSTETTRTMLNQRSSLEFATVIQTSKNRQSMQTHLQEEAVSPESHDRNAMTATSKVVRVDEDSTWLELHRLLSVMVDASDGENSIHSVLAAGQHNEAALLSSTQQTIQFLQRLLQLFNHSSNCRHSSSTSAAEHPLTLRQFADLWQYSGLVESKDSNTRSTNCHSNRAAPLTGLRSKDIYVLHTYYTSARKQRAAVVAATQRRQTAGIRLGDRNSPIAGSTSSRKLSTNRGQIESSLPPAYSAFIAVCENVCQNWGYTPNELKAAFHRSIAVQERRLIEEEVRRTSRKVGARGLGTDQAEGAEFVDSSRLPFSKRGLAERRKQKAEERKEERALLRMQFLGTIPLAPVKPSNLAQSNTITTESTRLYTSSTTDDVESVAKFGWSDDDDSNDDCNTDNDESNSAEAANFDCAGAPYVRHNFSNSTQKSTNSLNAHHLRECFLQITSKSDAGATNTSANCLACHFCTRRAFKDLLHTSKLIGAQKPGGTQSHGAPSLTFADVSLVFDQALASERFITPPTHSHPIDISSGNTTAGSDVNLLENQTEDQTSEDARSAGRSFRKKTKAVNFHAALSWDQFVSALVEVCIKTQCSAQAVLIALLSSRQRGADAVSQSRGQRRKKRPQSEKPHTNILNPALSIGSDATILRSSVDNQSEAARLSKPRTSTAPAIARSGKPATGKSLSSRSDRQRDANIERRLNSNHLAGVLSVNTTTTANSSSPGFSSSLSGTVKQLSPVVRRAAGTSQVMRKRRAHHKSSHAGGSDAALLHIGNDALLENTEGDSQHPKILRKHKGGDNRTRQSIGGEPAARTIVSRRNVPMVRTTKQTVRSSSNQQFEGMIQSRRLATTDGTVSEAVGAGVARIGAPSGQFESTILQQQGGRQQSESRLPLPEILERARARSSQLVTVVAPPARRQQGRQHNIQRSRSSAARRPGHAASGISIQANSIGSVLRSARQQVDDSGQI